jgi:ubiquinol-cytochrome c reductase cytochrome b subunit
VGEQIGRFILAGDTIGGATLSRFFAFHVFFIPAIVFAFIGLHLALVLRHGISERVRDGELVDPATYRSRYASLLHREGVPFWPDAAWRDVVFGAAVTATIVLLALIVGPPDLGPPPDPSILEAYPRPDWYFLWYFALLALAPNNLESAIIVLGPLVFGAVLLLVPLFNKGHRNMRRRPWAPLLVVFIWTTIVIFWVAGERADWSPDFGAQPLPASVVGDQRQEVVEGARLFRDKGCEFCHQIDGYGGRRGPELSDVASRMKSDEITARITNGGPNMPAYVRTLTPAQIRALTAFLSTRKP